MSDLQRLKAAAEKDPALFEKLSALEPEALVRWAKAEGYRLSLEEAKSLSAADQELSDEDLEQVAGGWSEPGDPSGSPPPGP